MSQLKSPINKITCIELQALLDNAESLQAVLRKFNPTPSSGNYRTLMKRIERDGLDLTKLIENRHKFMSKLSVSRRSAIGPQLTTSSKVCKCTLKKKLRREGLLPNHCAICLLKDTWQGSPIVLQLDHINGNNTDNSLTNLRWLCPNCHSQTSTFCGKNKQVAPKAKVELKKRRRKFDISGPELEKLTLLHPLTAIGQMFDVSDNAVRKRCKQLKVNPSPYRRGYWTTSDARVAKR